MTIGDILRQKNVSITTQTTLFRFGVQTSRKEDAFLQSCAVVGRWIEETLARVSVDVDLSKASAVTETTFGGIQTARDRQRFAASLWHVDTQLETRIWRIDVAVESLEGGDRARIDLRVRADHRLDDRGIVPSIPRFIATLMKDVGIEDVVALNEQPRRILDSEIDAFYHLVNAQERTLPVIAVSEQPLVADAEALGRLLAGLAHVVVLDPEASWKISHRHGYAYSCFQGAVRLYPVGWSFASDPSETQIWLAERVRSMRERTTGLRFESTVARKIYAETAAREEALPMLSPATITDAVAAAAAPKPAEKPQPRAQDGLAAPAANVIGQLKSELEQLQAKYDRAQTERESLVDDLRRARQEAAQHKSDAEEYFDRAHNAIVEIESLRQQLAVAGDSNSLEQLVEGLAPDERDLLLQMFNTLSRFRQKLLEGGERAREVATVRGELQDARRELASYRYGATAAHADEAVATPLRPAWDDFEGLDAWLQERYSGAIVLHPRVRRTLREGRLDDGDVLFDVLDILGTDFIQRRAGDRAANARFRERTKSYKYSRALTQTGAGVMGDDYAVEYNGRHVDATKIYKIREHSTDFSAKKVAVYFFYDEETKRVVITSMPKHQWTTNAHT
jgi:hypothetical protein